MAPHAAYFTWQCQEHGTILCHQKEQGPGCPAYTHPTGQFADSVSHFPEVDLSTSPIVSDYPIWANNNNLINDDSNSNYHLLRALRVSHCEESTFMY